MARLDAAIEFHFATLVASSLLWQRFQRYFLEYRELGFSLDISRMKFPDDLFEKMRPQIEHAFAAMTELETEQLPIPRRVEWVGHYWLRNPALAPTPQIRSEIEDTIRQIKTFAEDVHAGKITADDERRFKHLLHIGIGGSALGPQFVSAALGSPNVEVRNDRRGARFEVDDGITSGDYVQGFLRGTRSALYEKG